MKMPMANSKAYMAILSAELSARAPKTFIKNKPSIETKNYLNPTSIPYFNVSVPTTSITMLPN
jgi:hypothetical protein